MKKYLLMILFLFYCLTSFTQSRAVPFTLEDRDRIIQTEIEVKSLRNEMNVKFEGMETRFEGMGTKFESMETRFESIETRFDSQQKQLDNIYILLIFILGAVFSLIGFVIWDRRTAIKPVQREQEKLIEALKEYSRNHNDLGEILKKTGVL